MVILSWLIEVSLNHFCVGLLSDQLAHVVMNMTAIMTVTVTMTKTTIMTIPFEKYNWKNVSYSKTKIQYNKCDAIKGLKLCQKRGDFDDIAISYAKTRPRLPT